MTPPHTPATSLDLSLAYGLPDVRLDAARVEADVLQLFDAHAEGLRRYVRGFGLRPEVAEDVVQEVFLALFQHLLEGRPRHNLHGWMFRVAHNLALKQRRHQSRWLGPAEEWVAVTADPAAGPEDQLAEAERRLRLRSVTRALPDRDRQCLSLRAEGLNYRDIASVLGISLGSVSKSLARAIARLMRADSR